jgi:hypothetical protein
VRIHRVPHGIVRVLSERGRMIPDRLTTTSRNPLFCRLEMNFRIAPDNRCSRVLRRQQSNLTQRCFGNRATRYPSMRTSCARNLETARHICAGRFRSSAAELKWHWQRPHAKLRGSGHPTSIVDLEGSFRISSPKTSYDKTSYNMARNPAARNLPLAARPGVGHIGRDGAVAEWLKAAVC